MTDSRETLADIYAELDAADRLFKDCTALVEKATRQMNQCNYARETYAQLAGQLHDVAHDFHGDEDFKRLRRMTDEAEQSQEDAATGAERRALIDSQI